MQSARLNKPLLNKAKHFAVVFQEKLVWGVKYQPILLSTMQNNKEAGDIIIASDVPCGGQSPLRLGAQYVLATYFGSYLTKKCKFVKR